MKITIISAKYAKIDRLFFPFRYAICSNHNERAKGAPFAPRLLNLPPPLPSSVLTTTQHAPRTDLRPPPLRLRRERSTKQQVA